MLDVVQASKFIKKHINFNGETGIILGSGLGDFTDLLDNKKTLSFSKIPFYPQSNIEGHAGDLISGFIGDKQILVAKGRVHFYEGYSIKNVVFPIQVLKKCGVKNLIITNSSGSLRKEFQPGTIMLIQGYLDCSFRENLADPILKINKKYFSRRLNNLVKKIALKENINLYSGNYCWTLGPAYETPSEIEYFKRLGGSAVGMSTFPEVVEAGRLNLRVLTLSVLTNYAAGLSKFPLTHEEVLKTALKAKNNFIKILSNLIRRI